jgi:hypothetical protein
MNLALGQQSMNVELARDNLDGILGLQRSLSQQTEQLAVAAQNLEIMDAFRSEMSEHVVSLNGLRRAFVELAVMETNIGRIAHMIEPLVQIGSLSNLTETDIRAAARAILDRRATRLTQRHNPMIGDHGISVDSDNDGNVPVPPEYRK